MYDLKHNSSAIPVCLLLQQMFLSFLQQQRLKFCSSGFCLLRQQGLVVRWSYDSSVEIMSGVIILIISWSCPIYV